MNYFIYQACHNDCGLSCVKILMANLSKNKSFLFLPNPKAKDEPYSLLELINFGKENGLELKAFKSENTSLTSSNITVPCIITQRLDDKQIHTILIKKIYKNTALISDPAKGTFRKKISELEEKWDGKILEVKSFNPISLKIKRPKIIKSTDEIILCLIQTLSLVSCFVSMYFVNSNKNIVWSLAIFSLFLIFQFLHQTYLVHCLKRFDERFIGNVYDENEFDRKEKYQVLHNFKRSMFSTPSQLVSSLITSIFIIVLLINNMDKMLFACLGLLALAALDGLVVDPSFQRYKDELDSNEYILLKSNLDSNDFTEKIKQQSNLAYSFSSKIFMKKFVFIFITLFFDLLVLILMKNLLLSNILFYFFLLYFLFESLDDSMLFFNRYNLMNRTKERFMFYFKQNI